MGSPQRQVCFKAKIERWSKAWDSDFSNLESQMWAPYIKAKRYNKRLCRGAR